MHDDDIARHFKVSPELCTKEGQLYSIWNGALPTTEVGMGLGRDKAHRDYNYIKCEDLQFH